MRSATEAPSAPSKRLFSVEEYYRMAEAAVLRPDENLELLEGEVFVMERRTPPHAACTMRLSSLLFAAHANRLSTIAVHHPVRLDDHSEPEPDVSVLKRREDYYRNAHPGPGDALVLVEVSGAGEAYDRDVKVPLYARCGIPEVWLVRLLADSIRVYRTPENGAYRNVSDFGRGQTLSPSLLPEVALSTDDILG